MGPAGRSSQVPGGALPLGVFAAYFRRCVERAGRCRPSLRLWWRLCSLFNLCSLTIFTSSHLSKTGRISQESAARMSRRRQQRWSGTDLQVPGMV